MAKEDRNHFSLLCNIGALTDLLTTGSDIEKFLQRTVMMVSRHLDANICAIYLYDEKSEMLILRAITGADAIDKVHIKPGEGTVGSVFESLRLIHEGNISPRPGFMDESLHIRSVAPITEPYKNLESFLAVPIHRGTRKIGVIVVQHEDGDYFNETDALALQALASQLAGAIENARLLANLHKSDSRTGEKINILERLQFIKGESASGGYVFSKSKKFKRIHDVLKADDTDSDNIYSLDDFYKAVQKTGEQLTEFQTRLAERLLESASMIFTAHFMILKDAQFINKIVQLIMEGISPPRAVKDVTNYYIEKFSSASNAYIREKVSDIEDLSARILKNLYNLGMEDPNNYENRIVLTKHLYPSEILKIASENVKGIVLLKGGVTSHVAILSRSLKIPMVIADQSELLNLPDDTPVLLDADIGNIYIHPTEEIIQQFEKQNKIKKAALLLKRTMMPTTYTQDGTRVHLFANINLLSEIAAARELKAEGVGLYRTEFPFLIRPAFPSEEEQYLIYKRLFDEMEGGGDVTIRTLDIGGDKIAGYSSEDDEANPALGLRSIRFSLRHKDMFEQQLRAILRAAVNAHNPKIMFPMISSVDEFNESKQMVLDCIDSLNREGLPHHPKPAVGMMIEIPSVVEIIEELVCEADFFSIGTNDFIQYILAIDRTNEKMADYYCPYHPSVLRGLARVVRAVISKNKSISLCGEMAHESEYLPFLIGIGVRIFSVDPQFLPYVQERIGNLTLTDAEEQAKKLLSEGTLKGIREILQQQMNSMRIEN